MDSSSRNRPYESCAAPGPSVNRGRKRGSPCAGEPDSREQSELPSRGQLAHRRGINPASAEPPSWLDRGRCTTSTAEDDSS